MGTRATWTFKDGRKTVLKLYTQYDGYISGRGKDIADRFGATKIVNGYGSDMSGPAYANGMGCFAAQVLAFMKGAEKRGGIGGGVYATDTADKQEYNYVFTAGPTDAAAGFRAVHVKVTTEDGAELYSGPLNRMPTED